MLRRRRNTGFAVVSCLILCHFGILIINNHSDGTHRKEKGIKKYNEFLLAKNTELKADLEKSKRGMLATFAIAVVAVSAHMMWLTRKS